MIIFGVFLLMDDDDGNDGWMIDDVFGLQCFVRPQVQLGFVKMEHVKSHGYGYIKLSFLYCVVYVNIQVYCFFSSSFFFFFLLMIIFFVFFF